MTPPPEKKRRIAVGRDRIWRSSHRRRKGERMEPRKQGDRGLVLAPFTTGFIGKFCALRAKVGHFGQNSKESRAGFTRFDVFLFDGHGKCWLTSVAIRYSGCLC